LTTDLTNNLSLFFLIRRALPRGDNDKNLCVKIFVLLVSPFFFSLPLPLLLLSPHICLRGFVG